MFKKTMLPYKSASLEIKKKVPSLLVTIFLILFLLVSLSIVSFISGDAGKGIILVGAGLVFLAFLFALRKGHYGFSANGVIITAFVVLGYFVITADFSNPYSLHKATLYLFCPLVLCALVGMSFLFQRILYLVNLLMLAGLFAFFALPAAAGPLRTELIGQAVVDFFLFISLCVMMDRVTHISRSLVSEAETARENNSLRLKQFSSVVDNSSRNLDISQDLNTRIREVRERLGDSQSTLETITDELNSFESRFEQNLSAVGLIGEKIKDLHSYILEQNASQIESGAAVNEMVASIASVDRKSVV